MAQDPQKQESNPGFDIKGMLDALRSNRELKNKESNEEFDREMKLAEASAKGTLPPQDPMQDLATPPPQGLAAELANSLNNIKQANIPERDDLYSKALSDALAKDLPKALEQFRQEKSLAFSPAGKFGQNVGGILNLITAPLNALGVDFQLGTEIFGSRPSKAQELELLTNTLFKVSPLVRTELSDVQKHEWGTGKVARGMGMTHTAKFASEAKAERESVAYYTRFLTDLGTSADFSGPNLFSPDSTVDLTGALNAYGAARGAVETAGQIKIEFGQMNDKGQIELPPKAIAALSEQGVMGTKSLDAAKKVVQEFGIVGGTKEQLLEAVRKAQEIAGRTIKDRNTSTEEVLAARDFIENSTKFLDDMLPLLKGEEEIETAEAKRMEGGLNPNWWQRLLGVPQMTAEELGPAVPMGEITSQKGFQRVMDPREQRKQENSFMLQLIEMAEKQKAKK